MKQSKTFTSVLLSQRQSQKGRMYAYNHECGLHWGVDTVCSGNTATPVSNPRQVIIHRSSNTHRFPAIIMILVYHDFCESRTFRKESKSPGFSHQISHPLLRHGADVATHHRHNRILGTNTSKLSNLPEVKTESLACVRFDRGSRLKWVVSS